MLKQFSKARVAGIIILSAVIFAGLMYMMVSVMYRSELYPRTELAEGWQATGSIIGSGEPGDTYQRESIAITELPHGNRGDTMQLTIALPDVGYLPFPTLMFETRYCAFEVYLDDLFISAYDMQAVGSGAFVGPTYHLIALPKEYAGKTVSIHLYRLENKAGRMINVPVLGDHEELETLLIYNNFFALGSGFFLIVYGLSFLFITLLYLGRVPELLPQVVSSILCFAVGIIMVTNDHVAFIFMTADGSAVADYIALYMILPLGYLLLDVLKVRHMLPTRLYRGITWGSFVLICLFIILHFTNTVHLNRMLNLYYVIAVIGMVIILIDIAKGIKEKTLSMVSRVTLTGLTLIMFGAFIDMILIFLWRKGVPFITETAGRNLIPLGAMAFAASQLVNYLSFITESGSRQKDYESLRNIAYVDALTGLANRARADKVFEELDRGREDYCLVSIDVNGLKDTNDRLGHLAGDRLLREYASALGANFGDEALCARMGGDEFLVVMKRTNPDGFGVRLRRLYSDLDEMNDKDRSLFRSAALGYAFRHECHGGDAHQVYLLADERMFENKREQHIRYRIKERA